MNQTSAFSTRLLGNVLHLFHVHPCVALTDGHLILSNGKMNRTHTAVLCPQCKYDCNNNTVRVSTEDSFIPSGRCPHLPHLSANLHLLYVTATFMWFMWSVNAFRLLCV